MSNRKNYELIMAIRAELGGNFRGTFSTASESVRGLQTRVTELQKVQKDVSAYRDTERAIADLKAKREQLSQTDENYKKNLSDLNRQIDRQEQNLAGLNNKLKESGVDTQNLSAESARLGEEYRKLKAEQEKLANLDKWEKQNAEVLSRARADFLKTTAVVAGLGAAFYGAFISPAASFEAEMSNIAALTGYNAEQMKRLGDEVRATAQATGTPIDELASKANQLVEVGGCLDLVVAQMRYGTDLANATRTDMGLVFDFTSAAMKTFRLEAEESRAVMDSMAYTTSLTNLTLSQIAEAYVNVSGAANNAGFGINDVNAKLIVLSEAGLKGGAAGTSLNAILRNLSAPTNKAAAALHELGVELYDIEGASRDTFDIMGDLERRLASLNDEDRNNALSDIFDTVALKGWNMLADEGIDNIRELSDKIGEASEKYGGLGQSAGMAGVQLDNLKGDLALNKAALSELGMSIGEIFLPNIRAGAQGMTGMINTAGEWVRENPETVRQVVELGGKIALLTVGVKAFRLAKAAATKEVIAFRLASSGASATAGTLARRIQTLNPVSISAGIAIAGIALAVREVNKYIQEYKETFVDPLLFDNGGVRINELTDNLINNTRVQRENTQAVLDSRSRYSEIRHEIENINAELGFYGRNLRENGILTDYEAEAMREPFRNLISALEDDFNNSFNVVYSGLKNVSETVLEQIGADVIGIGGILRQFKKDHLGDLRSSQERVDYLFSLAADGEEIDLKELQAEMEYAARIEEITSDRTRERRRIENDLLRIDFGGNVEEAIEELTRLDDFLGENQDLLNETRKAIQESADELRDVAHIRYELGKDCFDRLNSNLEAINLAEYLAIKTNTEQFENFNSDVREIAERLKESLSEVRDPVYAHWLEIGMQLTDGSDAHRLRVEAELEDHKALKELNEMMNSINAIIRNTYVSPITIDVIPIKKDSAFLFQNQNINIKAAEMAWRYGREKPRDIPSHAGGLAYVPYDGYIAELHRGERVLTAKENESIKPLSVSLSDSSGKEIKIEVTYAPVLNIEGNAPDNLKEILEENSKNMVLLIKEELRNEAEDLMRTRYN
jgi:TP901 family phage tail tape measure protein